MKNTFLMWIIPLLGMLCPACSSNDGGLDQSKLLTIYGEEYELEQAVLWKDDNHTVSLQEDYVFEDHYQTSAGEKTDSVKGFMTTLKDYQTGNFMLGLYETGFVINEVLYKAQGQGACVWLQLASPETSELSPGKYIFDKSRDQYTFKGYSTSKYKPGETTPAEINAGEVEVSREGDFYTINFKCKTSFGGTVAGCYTGKPAGYNLSGQTQGVVFQQEIALRALFDTVVYEKEGILVKEPDYLRGSSFLNSSSKKTFSAEKYSVLNYTEKAKVDIAVAYSEEENAVYFESPIRMRALLWHNQYEDYNFDLPCHTRYMAAPADFKEADFESLAKKEDFVFQMKEEIVKIPIGITSPKYVFVVTGNGQMGVIRVREVRQASTEMIDGVQYQVNPTVMMDIKFPRIFSEVEMR